MAKHTLAKDERRALADLLQEVGPNAETLCEGWATRDLAAHLVIREARPDASAGIVVKPMERWTERVQDSYAERDYADLVEAVRRGPPRISFFSLPGVDAEANAFEYFVHHEDVRRADPNWTPRDLPADVTDELWRRLKRSSRMLFRRARTGVVLRRTDGGGGVHVARNGDPCVEIVGEAAELVMYAYGRTGACQVEVHGTPPPTGV